jgi:putative tRNA adenosine deaminase-associated protein
MPDDGTAVIVYREDGVWQATELDESTLRDLDSAIAQLRRQPAEGGAIGFLTVEDEFFVAVRLVGEQLRLLLSDRTAADEYELARQALVLLGEDLPEDDELDDVWPAGDLGIFSDFGLDDRELGTILDDLDLYADEMIVGIARRVGFTDAYAAIVDVPPH